MTFKFTFFFLMSLSLFFSACTKPIALESMGGDIMNPTYIKARCINDVFAQGQDKNVYGRECIHDKRLVIKTRGEGKDVITSVAQDNLKGEEPFVNKFYKLGYDLLSDKGDNSEETAYLKDLLPLGTDTKDFFGSKNTEYNIVFKVSGNYLVLYKSSTNPADIPYTERTALLGESGDEFMVPFLGYQIEYCNAELIKNRHFEETRENRANCSADSTNAKYIKLKSLAAEVFTFENKQDLLPANYFDGQWFFTSGAVESATQWNHIAPKEAILIEFTKYTDRLEGKDISGDFNERDQRIVANLSVQWVDYKLNKEGQNFKTFSETQTPNKNFKDKTHLLVQFPEDLKNVEDLEIKENYLSFLVTKINKDEKTKKETSIKHRYSFLKKSASNSEGFRQRKWFEKDHNQHFGVLNIHPPQLSRNEGEYSDERIAKHKRMIYVNASEADNTIKWYFSKNTPKEGSYRAIAKEAVRIWNQAFQIITTGSNKNIKIELVEDEDKNLGDLRYNVINMVLSKNRQSSGLFGYAPSYVNPNTGQIIATTSNVVVHTIEDNVNLQISHYIRDQIFQKEQGHNMADKDYEVVSPYIRSQIKGHCEEIIEFINTQRKKRLAGNLKPYDALKDATKVAACGKKVAKKHILATLIHEMGHSFGLAHNFKASVDATNYYENRDDVKNNFSWIWNPDNDFHLDQIPKTSSVMDYIPADHPQLTYLGKYDLAALRFLYRYQVEASGDQDFIDIDQALSPEEQTALSVDILDKKKTYLHCSDDIVDNLFCARQDYGSTPKEIIENHIASAKRAIHKIRYRYDKPMLPSGWVIISEDTYISVLDLVIYEKLLSFYTEWISLRDHSFRSNPELAIYRLALTKDEDSSSLKYSNYLNEIISSESKESTYKLFSEAIDVISDFFMDFLLKDSMKCHVTNQEKSLLTINFESIRDQLLEDAIKESETSNFYAENCYSPDVINFLTKHNLVIQSQSGLEDFETFFYSRPNISQQNGIEGSVLPISSIQRQKVFLPDKVVVSLWKKLMFQQVVREPHVAHKWRERIEKELLIEEQSYKTVAVNGLKEYQKLFKSNYDELIIGDKFSQLQEERDNYYGIQGFILLGTGDSSFDQLIEKPLNENGNVIENITDSSFLIEAHEAFKLDTNYDDDFKAYLLEKHKSEIVIWPSQQGKILIIPRQKNNFYGSLIKRYNKNVEKIDRLQEKSDRTFVEQVNLTKLQLYNEVLAFMIKEYFSELMK